MEDRLLEKLSVAIADDNERMVQLLDSIVSSDKDLEVAGTAGNGEDLIHIIKEKEPDVVLLDPAETGRADRAGKGES